ncbi:DUF1344 domain-containing protein [Neotabrizicola sp. sgz301269]|uniref:DUF1344 domain-containing protein n=1 Tax=Neotabrizicola sp. sgz301269 TaxID=3276282 RepID=UPI0037703D07
MKFRMFSALALAGLTATAALAGAMQASGAIKAIDPAAMTITLADGSVYVLPKGDKADQFKVGEKVTLTWTLVGTQHQIDTIKAAS